jgi:hypothetical protein
MLAHGEEEPSLRDGEWIEFELRTIPGTKVSRSVKYFIFCFIGKRVLATLLRRGRQRADRGDPSDALRIEGVYHQLDRLPLCVEEDAEGHREIRQDRGAASDAGGGGPRQGRHAHTCHAQGQLYRCAIWCLVTRVDFQLVT